MSTLILAKAKFAWIALPTVELFKTVQRIPCQSSSGGTDAMGESASDFELLAAVVWSAVSVVFNLPL